MCKLSKLSPGFLRLTEIIKEQFFHNFEYHIECFLNVFALIRKSKSIYLERNVKKGFMRRLLSMIGTKMLLKCSPIFLQTFIPKKAIRDMLLFKQMPACVVVKATARTELTDDLITQEMKY